MQRNSIEYNTKIISALTSSINPLDYNVNASDKDDSGYLSFTQFSTNHESEQRSKLTHFSKKNVYKTRNKPYLLKYNQIVNSCTPPSLKENSFENIQTRSTNTFLSSQLSYNLNDLNLKEDFKNSFGMELRSHQSKQLSSSICTSPCDYSFEDILPTQILSISPPLPSYKSDNNDTEMKLVLSHSTPNILNSQTLSTVLECSMPRKYRSKKLLEFNKHSIFYTNYSKRKPDFDYTGKETVDIFKFLAEKSNHPRIVSKILGYLNSQDLCSVSMVSKSWQRICDSDIQAQERRLKHILLKEFTKENLVSLNRSKFEEVQMSPKSRYPRKSFLTAVPTNLLHVPKIHWTPSSPPVSPSKIIFHSFIKAGRSLSPRDQLIPCPQCKFACRVHHEKSVGTCSRQGCPMEEFCLFCSSKLHSGEPCKMPLLATPTKRSKQQQLIVGTKQSKRNLRRISRLK